MDDYHKLSSYDYVLPIARIAQCPVSPRDRSRLLVVDSSESYCHQVFKDLVDWLEPNDLLVLNNTRVIPARLYGKKATGTAVEVLLLEEKARNQWLALVKPGKRLKVGAEIFFRSHISSESLEGLKAKVVDRDEATGGRILEFSLPSGGNLWDVLEDYGEMPFPPYVTEREATPEQYQTIYAEQPGAIAAPTAGLHFTEDLFERLAQKGIQKSYLTLHVGIGTFRPVEVENILDHTMHQEWIEIPEETVAAIREARAKGGRIFAVGTTVVRSLEGAMREMAALGQSELRPYRGKTDIFIYPGYQWQVIDGLITNFHL
ncbi:MAG: tRNA preQ1(34) S-adenosylmethionine ribosyltransferase-isomerase QueA, partial [Microcystaceae cyanobacterium]